MIDFPDIRDHLVSGLRQFMELPVVILTTGSPRPKRPFISFNFTTPFDSSGYLRPIESINPIAVEDSEDGEYEVEYTIKTQGRMILSVAIHTEDYDQSHQVALKAHGWFAYKGYQYIKDKDLVVSNLGSISNRDVWIIDSVERKLGFDITLRVATENKYTMEPIDTLSINEQSKLIKGE